jgi:archaellum component FlaC
MINNVNIDYDSFNEIYLNIPAGVGGSTSVYFDNIMGNKDGHFDPNYQNGEIIDIDVDEYCDSDKKEYIIGRGSDGDVTLKAIYDFPSDHSYKIESGYCINLLNRIDSIEDMNLKSEEDFEFNCVLIYYTIRKGDLKPVTNLYGVLFLEEVTVSDYNINLNEDDERAGYIQRYPKFKKGNSWGLKLDLKIDAQPDSQLELRDNTYVDPNESGVGMQMFTEALMQLNDCARLFYEVKKENTDIEERLYTLENMVSGIDTVYDLRDEVGALRTRIEMFQPTVNSLEGRLEDIESRITKLENNLGRLISDIKSSK